MAKPVVSQRLPTNKRFTDTIFISEWPFSKPLLTKEKEAEWTGDISMTYWSLAQLQSMATLLGKTGREEGQAFSKTEFLSVPPSKGV